MISREIISEFENHVILRLHVKPGSKKQELVVDSLNKEIMVFIKAPPDKGKANKELIKFLAKILGKNSSEISIITGQTSRDKTIKINNYTIREVERKITEIIED